MKSGGGAVVMRWAMRFCLSLAAWLSLTAGIGAAAQVVNPTVPETSLPGEQKQRTAEDALSAEQKRELLKKQNEVRQRELKKDTDKLFDLATELKQYVDKSNENILSLDVVKKAEQIEKLAKSVKDKMKGP